MQWFDHSSTASSDDGIVALRMVHPDSAAVDCYWAIVEKQFLEERPVPFDETNMETKALAHRLCLGFEVLSKYVQTMCEVGLLKCDGGKLYSERAKEAIEKYQAKRETARRNGKKGGRKPKRKPKANQTLTDDETQPKTNNNNNTSIGFDKQNQYQYASDGAALADATPPAACPTCDAPMERTSSHKPNGTTLYRCKLCAEEVWA